MRWLIAALLLIVAATVFLLLRNALPATGGVRPGAASSPADQALLAEIPPIRFTDVTAAAGISFRHYNGARGEKLLPETMGSGCAFFDFDTDGDQDILLVNSTDWPSAGASRSPHFAGLYRNDGRGQFADVVTGSGLDVDLYGTGVAIGDYDNDGRPDVFLTAVGGNRLFHNEGGGKFRELTDAGVGGAVDGWSTSAAWLDYDNDGDLDLFVCNYIRWSPEMDFRADYKLAGIGRAYGPPMSFPGTFPSLYRNDRERFTDVSASSGVQVRNKATGEPIAKSLGVVPVDLDGDHWLDLVVANDTVQNFVFHNERNGTFREIGEITGAAFDSFGKVRGAMGIDAARFADDDSVAISIGNFANEMTAFYVSKQNALTFTDEAMIRGIGTASRNLLTFGVFFFDYDLDGWLDLLTTNGHLDAEITKAQPTQHYRQPAQLFWNARAKRKAAGFIAVPPTPANADLFQPIVGRGSAFGDIDADGDLDVLLTQVAGAPLLLRNDQALSHHWVRLKLTGTRSNRDGIGAWLKLRAAGRTFWRHVMPARGYLSQSELPVTIGLGRHEQIDEVTVVWPGGQTQDVPTVKLDDISNITQAP